jgi:hypothetical protein
MSPEISHLRIAFGRVFRSPGYVAVAGLAAAAVVLAIMALPNLRLLGFVFSEDAFSPLFKLRSAASVIWNGRAVFGTGNGLVTGLIAALFGADIALTAYYLRRTAASRRLAGRSLAGVIIGLFGVGCASCGSVLLTALLGTGATLGAIGLLPFKGLEFGLVGAAVLAVSVSHTARKIADPDVCAVPKMR